MKYYNMVRGKFVRRLNRFVAEVYIGEQMETVHVKNTGRCRELLLPEAEVMLELSDNPKRKTRYDLVSVYKDQLGWVNIDSQACNRVVDEWLLKQQYSYIKPEYKYGDSRIDFYFEQGNEKFLMEVKGCTLEINGVGYFPDAPTERGIKHLRELAGAVSAGYNSILAFVIPMEGVTEVRPNMETHPAFGEALQEARKAGVEIWFFPCRVWEDGFEISSRCISRGIPCKKV